MPATGAMKPLDELRAAFAGAGVETDKADRDELRLRRLGAVLTLALYRLGVRAPRSMTAHGPNGACRRPAGRDRSGVIRDVSGSRA